MSLLQMYSSIELHEDCCHLKTISQHISLKFLSNVDLTPSSASRDYDNHHHQNYHDYDLDCCTQDQCFDEHIGSRWVVCLSPNLSSSTCYNLSNPIDLLIVQIQIFDSHKGSFVGMIIVDDDCDDNDDDNHDKLPIFSHLCGSDQGSPM